MTAPRSARPPGGPRDAGTTLMELLVVMSLTTVVLAAVGVVFTTATRSVREVSSRSASQADARTAMEAMTRSLRVAVTPTGVASAFVSATPSAVTFYASQQRTAYATATASASGATAATRVVLQGPTRVTLAYDSTRSCVTRTETTATAVTGAAAATTPWAWTGSGTTTCLARTTAPPVFTYYASGQLLDATGATTAPVAVPSTGLTASSGGTALASLRTVRSVQVDLAVTDPATPSAGTTRLSDRVTLTNIGTGSS